MSSSNYANEHSDNATTTTVNDIIPERYATLLGQAHGSIHDRKRPSVTSSDSCELVTTKKSRVETDGNTEGVDKRDHDKKARNRFVQSTTPPIFHIPQNRVPEEKIRARRSKTTPRHIIQPPKVAPKVKREQETVTFPNPSQSEVLRYLSQDFGLQLNDDDRRGDDDDVFSGSSGSCRWEDREFPSIQDVRKHLCHTGLVAPSREWFHENMQRADPICYFGGGNDLYVPKSPKASMICEWIRLAIVPQIYREKMITVERLAKSEVRTILRKMGVEARMGYFEMDGEELQWDQLEQKLATSGLSEKYWQHPGATKTEKLSLLLYYVDYKVITLQRESTLMPDVDVNLRLARPRRRAALKSHQVTMPNPQKSKGISVRSTSRVEAVDDVMATAEQQISFNFPFFGDDEGEEECMPDEGRRCHLEPLPPKRKKMRRKSVFGRRKLEPDELFGHYSLTSPEFWDTIGQPRPKSDNFVWGKSIGYRRHMGRVYFESFTLCCQLIRVGSFVEIENGCYKIISAFQATRSFVGRWNSKYDQLQNRGFAYVELAPLKRDKGGLNFLYRSDDWHPGHVEGAPTALFQSNGDPIDLECVNVECTDKLWIRQKVREQLTEKQKCFVAEKDAVVLTSRFALNAWPDIMNAQFKVLYANEREFELGTHEAITGFESDDSDEFDESSRRRVKRGSFIWNDELDCDVIDDDLEPSIMFDGDLLPKKDMDSKQLHDILQQINPLLDACVGCDESLKDVVSALRMELVLRTATSRLDDYFTLIRVPAKRGVGMVQKDIANKVGFNRYKSKIQQMACEHVGNREDTVMIAPCGSGKSMAFVYAALNSGGKVNIVIEPLNAIIKSQLIELEYLSAHMDIEQLYNEEEAKEKHVLSSYNRMQMIVNETKLSGWTSKPLLIFASAELIEKRLPQLKALAEEGCLSSVTLDEMDMIDRSNTGGRGVYTNLTEQLRQHCEGVKFIFLSGTVTPRGLVSLLPTRSIAQCTPDAVKPLLVIHERALADSLSFHVERKINDEQVAERMVWWIQSADGPTKCLCYCLTKSRCQKIARMLNDKGVSAIPVTSNEKSVLADVLQSFRSGQISVLCCTGVLGRGFHVDDIRFVFHASVPLDLTEYIQQTGRAGRDGKRARCILFYRAQDFETVRNIKINRNASEIIRESVAADIAEVASYATSSKCRYSQLASSATIEQCMPSDQRCTKTAPCDNCVIMGFTKTDIKLRRVFDSIGDHEGWDFKTDQTTSLSHDVLQLLFRTKVLEKEGRKHLQAGINFHFLHQQLTSEDVQFYVKHKKQDGDQDSIGIFEEDSSKERRTTLIDFEEVHDLELYGNTNVASASIEPLDCLKVPFLVRFESERARQKNDECESKIIDRFQEKLVDPGDCLDACEFLTDFMPRREAGLYKSALPQSPPTEHVLSIESFTAGVGLYFHGELDSNNVIRLLPPERAYPRRIFRKFGSHRFLHVKVPGDLHDENVIKTFTQKTVLCGRTYAYLWCKAQKSPQCFVLFAERGFGITKEISAEEVLDWCIPRDLNPGLTIGKELKRMKLSFSKTNAAFVLPENSVELIEDILGESGIVMTDGAGLISRDALNEVWKCQITGGESPLCPFSSFQGRIGGFKGMWVLDDSLSGIRIQCRRSQLKFNVPMKSLVFTSNDTDMNEDSMYDTVEVNSWDEKAEKGFLVSVSCQQSHWIRGANLLTNTQSVRLVQILERRGVSLEFFKRCADKGLGWLDELDCTKPSSQASFYDEIRNRHSNIVAMNEKDVQANYDILFHMASAKLDPSEPYYAAQRRKFVKKTADSMRNKARYPLKDSWHVRMLPDHVQLLKEGEAFVALPADARGSLKTATEVLTFRNPSYFDGDLRKLTLVHYEDLLLRADAEDTKAGNVGQESFAKCKNFFGNLTTAIVLSTLGSESEADRMSGGDYDGDKAWICFDQDLVEQVVAAEPASRPDPLPKDQAELRLLVHASWKDRVKFARHFKNHQRQLGYLATKLDGAMDMFDDFSKSPVIDDLARQAFLQVDHPYQLCAPKSFTTDYLSSQKEPHWFRNEALHAGEEHAKVYRSEKAMGFLWDYVEKKIERAVSHGNGNEVPNTHILELADTACTRSDFTELKSKMRRAANAYYSVWKELTNAKASLEKIGQKCQLHAQAERARLIINASESEDERTLAAAVLYKECGDSKRFAWRVAPDYLFLIVVRAQNRGKSTLPLIMDPEIDRLAFGKSKRK